MNNHLQLEPLNQSPYDGSLVEVSEEENPTPDNGGGYCIDCNVDLNSGGGGQARAASILEPTRLILRAFYEDEKPETAKGPAEEQYYQVVPGYGDLKESVTSDGKACVSPDRLVKPGKRLTRIKAYRLA